MSIACPYCEAVLNPKGLKPGRFQPKCPGCGQAFHLVIEVKPLATKTVPKQRVLSVEEQASLLLEGKNPADYGTLGVRSGAEGDPNATGAVEPPEPKKVAPRPPARDPNVTGDFTEGADDGAPAKVSPRKPRPVVQETIAPEPVPDVNATGDFTDAGATAPPRMKPAPTRTVVRAPNADPNTTGDFTAPGPGVEHAPVGEATGELTTARPEPNAEPEAKAKVLRPDPNRTAKPGEQPEDDSFDLDDDTPPRLGGYEVLKVLGRGGMGAVLLGRQLSLDRKVALKVMHPKIASSPSFVARFTREAYAAAQLTHHNVVQVYDIGEDHGQHFFSMEFVHGQSLMELVKQEGRLAADVAVGYTLQAARGLRYGHKQGMVHRDIKPDNLMLNTEGIVKVADLGLVKLPGGELGIRNAELGVRNKDNANMSFNPDSEFRAPNLTSAGAVMGTPAYMSPEQSTDSATVDARADVYSLGCSLYVMLTGKPPFEGKTALEIISKHQTEPLVPPEVVVKRVPKALSAILLKMMAKKPGDRLQSMDEVIAALEGFLGLERAGTFNPKEEQADQLEKCAHQYQFRAKAGLKRSLALGFFAACVLGVVGAAFAGLAGLAGGLLGLALMTPVAYFTAHGTLTGSVVSQRLRAVVFGMRFFDWVMWAGGSLLFLVTLFLFGLLWHWLGFAFVATGLALALWFLTDRAATNAQAAPLDEARGLLRALRLQGLEEDAVRQFVCKFSGPYWEPLYESLFGYEAMLAARASRKGDTGETWKKSATWRDPIVLWADARVEARRAARELAHLKKVEAKALVAEGVSAADAKAQAEEMAGAMVEHAGEAKQARKEGKEVSVRELVASARERRRPKAGVTIAGKKHRSLWLRNFLNDWLGRRLRLALGAFLFAAGLLWLSQNNLLQGSKIFTAITEGNIDAAQQAATSAGKIATKPLAVPGDFIPAELKPALNSWALPLTGLLVLLNGVFYFGWRPSLVTVPGAVIAVFGPTLGVPTVEPLTAQHLSLIVGAAMVLVFARFLRQ